MDINVRDTQGRMAEWSMATVSSTCNMHFISFKSGCSVHESGRGSNPRSVITFLFFLAPKDDLHGLLFAQRRDEFWNEINS